MKDLRFCSTCGKEYNAAKGPHKCSASDLKDAAGAAYDSGDYAKAQELEKQIKGK